MHDSCLDCDGMADRPVAWFENLLVGLGGWCHVMQFRCLSLPRACADGTCDRKCVGLRRFGDT